MHKTHEFLSNQHDHVFESIKLFDQKAAATIAITIGALYVLATREATNDGQRMLAITSLLFLTVGVLCSLFAMFPWADVADRSVLNGELTIPIRSANLGQAKYEAEIKSADDDRMTKDLVALIFARGKIRSRKFHSMRFAVGFSGIGILLMAIRVGCSV